MKKLLTLLLALTTAVSLAACGAPEAPAEPSEPAPSASEPAEESSKPEENEAEPAAMPGQERLSVADASRFLGTVEDFAVDDAGQTVLLMRRATGSDLPRELKVTLTEDTNYSFDSAQLGNGAFLEVYYGGEPDETGAVDAIAVNDLISEDLVVYNGTLVEITTDPEKEEGCSLLLDPLTEDGMQYVFHVDESTQFYLDFASLKAGDKLHVIHSPASTRSLPPQSAAWEISPYTEPEAGELPAPAAEAPADGGDALVEAPLGSPENPIASEPAAE
ncbi:hypothetical protein [Anaerotruncus massiliensis (ex Togo et al. 2019)]|uniref:hypothetical protein n=1 Tax=Anaerotruncus TaxID=244127 RepID=UPI001A9A6B15|nr:hypothetical protein [Anaerotruncus massiliensis (ex Togo et al. 2019)]